MSYVVVNWINLNFGLKTNILSLGSFGRRQQSTIYVALTKDAIYKVKGLKIAAVVLCFVFVFFSLMPLTSISRACLHFQSLHQQWYVPRGSDRLRVPVSAGLGGSDLCQEWVTPLLSFSPPHKCVFHLLCVCIGECFLRFLLNAFVVVFTYQTHSSSASIKLNLEINGSRRGPLNTSTSTRSYWCPASNWCPTVLHIVRNQRRVSWSVCFFRFGRVWLQSMCSGWNLYRPGGWLWVCVPSAVGGKDLPDRWDIQ